jgi:organic hydroperoxide reductase OsmC/OhrA
VGGRAAPDLIRERPDARRPGTAEASGVRAKEYRFPVRVEWIGGRDAVAGVLGKPPLAVAPPREFNPAADPAVWSPEDLFCNAAAACLAVGIARLARQERLPLVELDVVAEGVVGLRDDGRFGFTRLEQVVELVTESGFEAAARDVVARAEASCLVAASLDLEIETTVICDTRAACTSARVG